MSDNELLLAISEIMEKKIKAEMEPIKADMKAMKDDTEAMKDDIETIKAEMEPIKADMKAVKDDIETIKTEQKRINLVIENEIRSNIKLLAENYMPAAKKYTKEAAKIEAMQADIDVMKNVIREHSEKLQKIS